MARDRRGDVDAHASVERARGPGARNVVRDRLWHLLPTMSRHQVGNVAFQRPAERGPELRPVPAVRTFRERQPHITVGHPLRNALRRAGRRPPLRAARLVTADPTSPESGDDRSLRRWRQFAHERHEPARRPGRLLSDRGPRPPPDRLRLDAARWSGRLRAAARPRRGRRGAADRCRAGRQPHRHGRRLRAAHHQRSSGRRSSRTATTCTS